MKSLDLGRRSLAAVLLLAGLGCASSPSPDVELPTARRGDPWQLSETAYGTQRMLRARYAGPEGDAVLRLVLRLERGDRFQLQAADRLGRALWDLQVQGEAVLWVDHQEGLFCHGLPRVGLPAGFGQPLPLRELPAVLLGALPAPPRDSTAAEGRELAFVDAEGRRWSARLGGDGEVREWALWGEGGILWRYQRAAGGGLLWQPEGGRRLEWEQGLVEVAAGLSPLAVPGSYREDCGE